MDCSVADSLQVGFLVVSIVEQVRGSVLSRREL